MTVPAAIGWSDHASRRRRERAPDHTQEQLLDEALPVPEALRGFVPNALRPRHDGGILLWHPSTGCTLHIAPPTVPRGSWSVVTVLPPHPGFSRLMRRRGGCHGA